ncbi:MULTISPECIES: hypothetical protein [Streptomyces]|uniref:hypothetical protein n=1 Tax=Streptomyces TaxID=1883 RepID=UPI000AB0DC0A|nr:MULTISPECIES: hypothetical protein [Streptomyces]
MTPTADPTPAELAALLADVRGSAGRLVGRGPAPDGFGPSAPTPTPTPPPWPLPPVPGWG